MIPCRNSRSAHFWDSVGMLCRSGDPCDPCDLCVPDQPGAIHLQISWWDRDERYTKGGKCLEMLNARCSSLKLIASPDDGTWWDHIVNLYDTICIYFTGNLKAHDTLVLLSCHTISAAFLGSLTASNTSLPNGKWVSSDTWSWCSVEAVLCYTMQSYNI